MRLILSTIFLWAIIPYSFAQNSVINKRIFKIVDELICPYNKLYSDLHQNPELSLQEFRTAAKMAESLRLLGFEVTKSVGANGVVGVFKNGEGKVIMLRTDMDALPIKETTGLSYASKIVMNDATGKEVPVMHACGHDMHMSIWLGTLSTLVKMKDAWHGTIVAIAQSAEELGLGAQAMIDDGLFKRFPQPDYIMCYHVSADLPAGTIGYYPGPIFAGVQAVNMKIYGRGGHGAMPHTTIDPIVIAARIILDLQTIVSREINPVKPAVVSIGSIHGGISNSTIPNEVELLITIRFFEDEIHDKIMEAIKRISRGVALSAGLTEDKMPLIKFSDRHPPTANNPELVFKTVDAMSSILDSGKIIQVDPATVAEDFGSYGITKENIPIALFWIGGVNTDLYHEHLKFGTFIPSLHSSAFAPDFEPTFRGGVVAMSRALMDLF